MLGPLLPENVLLSRDAQAADVMVRGWLWWAVPAGQACGAAVVAPEAIAAAPDVVLGWGATCAAAEVMALRVVPQVHQKIARLLKPGRSRGGLVEAGPLADAGQKLSRLLAPIQLQLGHEAWA